MQQNGSKYFAGRPPTQPSGSIVQNSTFSEHSHVADQIKKSHKWDNMVGNILAADPPPWTYGVGSKAQNSTSSDMIMLRIKLKGIKNAVSWLQIFLPAESPTSLGSIGQNSTFSEQCQNTIFGLVYFSKPLKLWNQT